MLLPAEALSVEHGGVVDRLEVGGDLVTYGAKVTTYAVEGGKVNAPAACVRRKRRSLWKTLHRLQPARSPLENRGSLFRQPGPLLDSREDFRRRHMFTANAHQDHAGGGCVLRCTDRGG